MPEHYRFQTYVEENDERTVWLEVPGLNRNPVFSVSIGASQPDYIISGNYRCRTTPDSAVAQHFKYHAVLEDALHPAVLKKMDVWIENCNEKHSRCAHIKDRKSILPTRVLDLSSLPSRQEMAGDPHTWHELFKDRSCTLKHNTPGSNGRYIALSYCWGKSLAYTTTSTNLATHARDDGIPFAHLPRTLQDALLLTRYLALDYIWADCLCIIQDDKADWEHEAARMADVYSNAYFTLAATRASDCGEGFLKARKVGAGDMVHFEDIRGTFNLSFVYDDCTISPGSMESVTPQPLRVQRNEPLLDRVWCFQERVLAIRTLHLASDQMYWECAQSFEQEQGDVDSSDDSFFYYKEYSLKTIAHDLVNRSKRGDAWYRMVQEYTSRTMTYQTDKLPAFSGIASALQQMTGDTCYAGIWKSWFLEGLLWRLQRPSQDVYVFVPKPPSRLDFWRAPSWSFAALEGVVLYDILERFNTAWKDLAVLEDCQIVPSGKNPLGEIKTGHARIRGPITTLTSTSQKHIGNVSNGKACTIKLSQGRNVLAGVYFDVEEYDECDVLMTTPYAGLAIRRLEKTEDSYLRVGAVGMYQRMGVLDDDGNVLDVPDLKDLEFSAADFPPSRTITLL
ncbi:heterokaryon incompatibility protein-domain-containing protein [Paraphoma chrysanthemicola]|uniref:Heterokaryon incompatibility protein-domain-containing protein n=1 Tax=Paraphoma chrysanthemicola TaxID=798071 RepID=A0A8K0VTD2_9PLEO|nr:heterokaryon incompatibility protein-domain-containing protein [Paraphoma chrysanthemicola]